MMKSTFARICPLDQIDILVTDEPLSPAFAEDLAAASVQVIIAA
jgi:DeoR family transcriptional regulator, aga operon transcriptional repressor